MNYNYRFEPVQLRSQHKFVIELRFEPVTRLHQSAVGHGGYHSYIDNLFVVTGLLEFICICLLYTRSISTLSIPKFSLSSHFPALWFVLKLCIYYDPLRFCHSIYAWDIILFSSYRGCKSSSPQHLPSNWESVWYERHFFRECSLFLWIGSLNNRAGVDQVCWNVFGV